MKIPKKFKELTEIERRKYANKKKAYYEKRVEFWTSICRKLSANIDFTPLEIDLIDTVLEKEYPAVKDCSNVKFKDGVLVEKLKSE